MEIWDLRDTLNQIWDRIWDLWEIYDQRAACYGNKLLLTLQYENDKFSFLDSAIKSLFPRHTLFIVLGHKYESEN